MADMFTAAVAKPPSTATEIKQKMLEAISKMSSMSDAFMSDAFAPEDYAMVKKHGLSQYMGIDVARGPRTPDIIDYKGMIASRLRTSAKNLSVFPFCNVYAIEGDKVFVFLVAENKPVVLEDDFALFPSDKLMTQLRLLL